MRRLGLEGGKEGEARMICRAVGPSSATSVCGLKLG